MYLYIYIYKHINGTWFTHVKLRDFLGEFRHVCAKKIWSLTQVMVGDTWAGMAISGGMLQGFHLEQLTVHSPDTSSRWIGKTDNTGKTTKQKAELMWEYLWKCGKILVSCQQSLEPIRFYTNIFSDFNVPGSTFSTSNLRWANMLKHSGCLLLQ